MKANTSIRLLIWLASGLFMVIFFLLPSCVNQQQQEKEKRFRKVSQEKNRNIKASANKGRLATTFQNDTLILLLDTLGNKKVETIRIYDQKGALKFMDAAPSFGHQRKFKVNCTYFNEGEYLILLYLSDGELIEETIELY